MAKLWQKTNLNKQIKNFAYYSETYVSVSEKLYFIQIKGNEAEFASEVISFSFNRRNRP